MAPPSKYRKIQDENSSQRWKKRQRDYLFESIYELVESNNDLNNNEIYNLNEKILVD